MSLAAPPAAPVNPQKKRRRRKGIRVPLWYIAPALAIYLLLVIWPSVQGVGLAFTNWDGLSPDKEFVGLDNFQRLLEDPIGLDALLRTLFIAIALLILQNAFGLALALALNSRIKSRKILRTAFFAPAVLSSVVLGYMFQYIFSPTGPLNQILELLGLESLKRNWLGDPAYAVGVIVFVIVWQSVGSTMVIYLAGLQGVPAELLEAASIDGAGPFRRFFSVTLPQLAPAVTINFMLTLIGGLRVFDQVFVLTRGGPANGTQTISTLMIQQAFEFGRYGYGAAMAVVLTIMVAILSAVQYYLLRRQRTA